MQLSVLVISCRYELLNRMLKSFISSTEINKSNIEILCSWNGNDSDIKKIYFPKTLNLKIFKVKPYNFANNMNGLIKKSIGEYVLLINDDVILDKKSIDFGIKLLQKNKTIGLVGGKLRDRKGNLTHAGVNFSFFNSPYHYLEGIVKSNDKFLLNNNFSIPAATGALMLTYKNVLEEVQFNEKYKIYCEDIELCLDIRQFLKREIWFCHKLSGIHEAETTKNKVKAVKKNIFDKKLLLNRYNEFFQSLNKKELLKVYDFDKRILEIIFKYKIKSWSKRFHTDFWIIVLINMFKIKIIIFSKEFKSKIKKILNFLSKL